MCARALHGYGEEQDRALVPQDWNPERGGDGCGNSSGVGRGTWGREERGESCDSSCGGVRKGLTVSIKIAQMKAGHSGSSCL